MPSNLTRRILVAVVAIPVVLVVVYLGGWVLAAALAALGVLGARELYGLAEGGGVQPVREAGYVGSALFPFGVFAASPGGLGLDGLLIGLAAALWLMSVMGVAACNRAPGDGPLASVSVSVFAAIYAGGMPALLVLLRHPEAPLASWPATWLVFFPLVVVWTCDTFAMAGGTLIGGPKLTPVLSPNKTWAGAIAGIVGAMVVAPCYGKLILSPVGLSLPVWQLVMFGFVISTVGQSGDVVESLFKREVGAKDSGGFFPGHGGVLDRLDSLYWAIPTSVILLAAFGVI